MNHIHTNGRLLTSFKSMGDPLEARMLAIAPRAEKLLCREGTSMALSTGPHTLTAKGAIENVNVEEALSPAAKAWANPNPRGSGRRKQDGKSEKLEWGRPGTGVDPGGQASATPPNGLSR